MSLTATERGTAPAKRRPLTGLGIGAHRSMPMTLANGCAKLKRFGDAGAGPSL